MPGAEAHYGNGCLGKIIFLVDGTRALGSNVGSSFLRSFLSGTIPEVGGWYLNGDGSALVASSQPRPRLPSDDGIRRQFPNAPDHRSIAIQSVAPVHRRGGR